MGNELRQVVIAGGSGLLGQVLAEYFLGEGWRVVVLTRGAGGGGSGGAGAGGVVQVRWSGVPMQRRQAWEEVLAGSEVLINLAGRSVNCRYTRGNRRAIMDSRILSTRAPGQALGRCERLPAVWLNSSTATIYRHNYGPAHDETGEIGPHPEAADAFSLDVATAWEREFFEAPVAATVRKVALRTAIVLSHRKGNMVGILRGLTGWGLGGGAGSGRQWVSWIHERDFCRAVGFVVEHLELAGVVNVAAPGPVTNAEMMATFRRLLGRRVGLPAPRWLLEIGAFFHRTETELLIKSRRVVAGKLPAAGFGFEFTEFGAALSDLLRRF